MAGIVTAHQLLTITMRAFSMPLNNLGDEVSLLDPLGQVRQHVSYTAVQVGSGTVVTCKQPEEAPIDGDAWPFVTTTWHEGDPMTANSPKPSRCQ